MDVLRNNEEKLMCPYNAAHYIRRYRMEVHLTKCRKSYKESEILVECDFNACHRIPEPELQYHHETCPDRKSVELQIFCEDTGAEFAPVPSRPAVPVPVDDSWDEVQVPSYDPQKYCLENDILRRLDVESAAKRRDFRIAERHRLNNLGPAKNSVPGRTEPAKPASNRGTTQTLPPTPSFSASNIESTPESVTDLMNRLEIIPKRAVVPKQVK